METLMGLFMVVADCAIAVCAIVFVTLYAINTLTSKKPAPSQPGGQG